MDTPPAANGHAAQEALSAEAVADMLDTLDAADLSKTIAGLEQVLSTLRPAASVRARLVGVDRETLKAALALRRQRRGTARR
jgi:hypothetical protein